MPVASGRVSVDNSLILQVIIEKKSGGYRRTRLGELSYLAYPQHMTGEIWRGESKIALQKMIGLTAILVSHILPFMGINIVLDTNVLVSALRSSQGASFRLLSMVEKGSFTLHLSTTLVAEYEAVLKRENRLLTTEEIDDIIDFICSRAVLNKIFYLWRPVLKDPGDDFILELAVKANAIIVTWNEADFINGAKLGVAVMTPRTFLEYLEEHA